MQELITIIRDAAEATTGLNAFGEGDRPYSDLNKTESGIEVFEKAPGELYPRAWLLPVKVTDEILNSGALDGSYTVEILYSKAVKLSANAADLRQGQNELLAICREHYLRIKKAPGVLSVGKATRVQLFHKQSANLVGWFVTFSVKFKESITYPC